MVMVMGGSHPLLMERGVCAPARVLISFQGLQPGPIIQEKVTLIIHPAVLPLPAYSAKD